MGGRPTSSARRRFERLYREHFAFVWAAARGFGVPAGALEDATQDVFVTAYRKLDEIRTEVSPRGWLYGVTRRVAHRYRRGLARQARRHAAYAHEPHAHSEEPHEVHDATRWLRRALRELDPAQRETFVMAELLGMSGPEIAAHQGVPVNTVYSRVRLARKQLRGHDETSNRLSERIVEVRRHEAPSPEQRQRVWVGVLPAIERLAEVGAVAKTTVGAATLGWIGATVVAAGVGALMLSGRPRAAEADSPTTEVTQRSVTPVSAPVELPDPLVEASTERVSSPVEPAPERPVRSRRRDAPSSATPESEPRGLTEELELLDRAQQALERGAAKEALAWADRHAREFPRGQLADVREATRVGALCRLGRVSDAKRVHAALLATHPASTVVRTKKLECW